MAPLEDDDESLHIVMFPWLAFGHMIPFLELSKCLAKKGHRISFISTPRNIERLVPKIPQGSFTLINFIQIPLPHVDQLPDEAEATSDVPFNKVEYLKKAFDGLESPFASFIEASSPDWIIYDFAPHWLPPIAAKYGVLSAYFSIFNASTQSVLGHPLSDGGPDPRTKPEHFTVPPKWIPFPNNMVLRLYEILRVFEGVVEDNNFSGVSDIYRIAATVRGCDIVAVRSCTEFEPEWLRFLQEVRLQKPVLPVGLLPPPLMEDDNNEEWFEIREWLDKQNQRSVVYVAFGSEATPSREETTKLALGLELTQLPFFWVLRKPDRSDHSFLLPSGFQDRIQGRGFICTNWVPQLKILNHPSVGGFLSHSGWSSVIESLGFGCPLILFPLINDQTLVARLLEWKNIGLEISRNELDGSFTKESVAESIRKVIVDPEGETYRSKAKDLKEVFGNRALHDRYVDDFSQYLKDHCHKTKLT